MAKIRLNKDKRQKLRDLAESLISFPELEAQLKELQDKWEEREKKAYQELSDLALKITHSIYDPDDMKVLEKYQKAAWTEHVCIRLNSTNYYDRISVKLSESVLIPFADQVVLSDEQATQGQKLRNLQERHQQVLKDMNNELSKPRNTLATKEAELRGHYFKIINTARYFEDVTDVWDEANSLRSEFEQGSTALVSHNLDSIIAVARDVQQRKRRQEQDEHMAEC